MARSYRPRYDTLLRVRRRQEELKAQALAEVRREIERVTLERDELARQQQLALEKAEVRDGSVFRADEVQAYYQYERHLARMAVEKDARIRELGDLAEQRRMELDEALKQRRMVEKLAEREAALRHAATQKKEQANLDEAATNQAALERGG